MLVPGVLYHSHKLGHKKKDRNKKENEIKSEKGRTFRRNRQQRNLRLVGR